MELDLSVESLQKCTIGNNDDSLCHNVSFHSHKAGIKFVRELKTEDQVLLSRRCGLEFDEASTVCLHHEALLLTNFTLMEKSCCNPFGKLNHSAKKSLQPIHVKTADYLTSLTKNHVKPGQKLCPSCRKEVASHKESAASPSSTSDSDDETVISEKVNTSLTAIGISPVKIPRLISSQDNITYAKKKLDQVKTTLTMQIATLGHLHSNEIIEPSTSMQCESCSEYYTLLEGLKQKMKLASTSYQEKLQILTLVTAKWSIKKIAEEFDVSERMVKKARKLKEEGGLLAMPGKKQGKKLLDEIKQKVLAFYEDDEFTRLCPGKKDYVSVRLSEDTKVQVQKRLILCNLKELYAEYRTRYGSEIGFSKFCELRPKSCITVSASGTHSVCVCAIHQNVKLMLQATPIKDDYKCLISKTVCSLDSKDCMLHRCEECPQTEELIKYLQKYFEDNDREDTILYKQWVHTDRDTLESKHDTIEDFIEALVSKILKLSSHHYIAKFQSHHLKATKENLKPCELVILMDFAENYSFIVQDAVQGFHWENSQATLHPFVVYYKNANQLQSISFSSISDCLQHDTIAVHVFLYKLIEYLKNIVGEIVHIYYFSDGSAAQYKNYKNFMNLCHHENDFNCTAEWNFFVTSHGKSPCDGIGGTIKRSAARASLQRPVNNQILTPQDLFSYCVQQIKGIKCFFISKEEIEAVSLQQEQRFKDGRTVAGTRENHHFVPINEATIRVSRVSNDSSSSFLAHLNPSAVVNPPTLSIASLQPGQYVACIYENKWWIGNICEISLEEHDVLINFMHPYGIASSFYWPPRRDTCWIPEQHIIANVPAPNATAMGRQYTLTEMMLSSIEDKFQSIVKQ